MFWVVVVLLVVLPWLGYRSVRDWIGPGAADPPAAPVASVPFASPVAVAPFPAPPHATADVAAAAEPIATIGGGAGPGNDGQDVARRADLDADAHRDAILADRGSAIRREAARREVEAIPGVRAAGWVDRMSMVVVTSGAGMSGYQTISEACRRLGAHGDVTGVAITVQDVAAGGRRPASPLAAECAANVPGDASLQAAGGRVLPGRALHPAAVADATDAAELEQRRIRQAESLRILSESTPALPEAQ
ncbi:hypothetical protein [Luteimonas sp. MC1828]|uniref:hypothetical protein n=1 Tax=Luteimonas sp. MC1828 TaxID=2799787 RepID=UPI0018F1407C|nr:hypothetical protein [Luteimonas sp. MC1828]MBJ7573938.1 hypothetical protein [Luteimonas sp. MC1828]